MNINDIKVSFLRTLRRRLGGSQRVYASIVSEALEPFKGQLPRSSSASKKEWFFLRSYPNGAARKAGATSARVYMGDTGYKVVVGSGGKKWARYNVKTERVFRGTNALDRATVYAQEVVK